MFGIPSGRLPGFAGTGDLADVAARGGDGGSGMVPAGAPITTDPNAGGRVDDLGAHPVLTNPQGSSDLRPIPGVETRPMLGGLRTAHHAELLHDSPMFDGGHVELSGRVSVVILEPFEQLEPEAGDTLPSLRVPPVSDPYGRMCNNAATAMAGGRK